MKAFVAVLYVIVVYGLYIVSAYYDKDSVIIPVVIVGFLYALHLTHQNKKDF